MNPPQVVIFALCIARFLGTFSNLASSAENEKDKNGKGISSSTDAKKGGNEEKQKKTRNGSGDDEGESNNEEDGNNGDSLAQLEKRLYYEGHRTVAITYKPINSDYLSADQFDRPGDSFHPLLNVETNDKIESFSLGYFHFLHFDSPERVSAYVASERFDAAEMEWAYYCAQCAFSAKETLISQHQSNECRAGKNELNRLFKLSTGRFPDFNEPRHDRCVIVVRTFKASSIEDVKKLKRIPGLLSATLPDTFFVRFKTKTDSCHVQRVLDGHRMKCGAYLQAYLVPSKFNFKYFNFTPTQNNSSIKAKRSVLAEVLWKYETPNAKEHSKVVLVLGSFIKHALKGSTSNAFVNRAKLLLNAKKFVCAAVPTKPEDKQMGEKSEYYSYGLAWYKNEEEAKTALAECQFHYILGEHINICSLKNFLARTPTAAIRIKRTPNTSPRSTSTSALADRDNGDNSQQQNTINERIQQEFGNVGITAAAPVSESSSAVSPCTMFELVH